MSIAKTWMNASADVILENGRPARSYNALQFRQDNLCKDTSFVKAGRKQGNLSLMPAIQNDTLNHC